MSANVGSERFANGTWRLLPTLIFLCVAMAAAWSRWDLPLNHDVSWLFVAAERLLDGGRFGQEIYELNAPGAVLLYVPPALVARSLALDPKFCILVYTAGVLTTCMILARGFLVPMFAKQNLWRAEAIVVCWATIWAFLPGYDFAQREHFIAMLLLPFILCETCLTVGSNPGLGQQVTVAALAALAIMIKPQFVALPASLLLMRASVRGMGDLARSPAVATIALAGSAYLAVTVTLFSGWIEVAHNAALLYDAYGANIVTVLRLSYDPTGTQPLHLFSAALGMIVVAALVARRDQRLGQALFGMSTGVLVFLLVYLVQMKGFNYHLLPATGTSSCAAILAAAALMPESFARPRDGAANGLVALILVATILRATLEQSFDGPPVNRALMQLLQARASAGPVYAFVSGMRPMFPIVTEAHLDWASRFPCMWTLVGLQELRARAMSDGPGVAEETIRRLEREQIDQVIEDLRKSRPATIVVDVGEPKQWLTTRLDFIAYYSQDPRFVELWANYLHTAQLGRFAIYIREQRDGDTVGEIRGR